MNSTITRQTKLVALFGAVCWSIAMLAFQPGWAAALLSLAPSCLIPLAYPLVVGFWPNRSHALNNLILLLQVIAAVLLLASFAFPQGVWTAAFAGPWIFCCVGASVFGFTAFCKRFLQSDRRRAVFAQPIFFVEIGMMFLAVGGGWLFLSRLGLRPLGFSPVIVLATAIHFHYAGFLLPILVAKCVAHRNSIWPLLAGWGVVLGVPAVAVGITLSVWDIFLGEWIATWWLTICCGVIGWEFFRNTNNFGPRQKWCLRISAGSLLVAMTLAAGYAFARYWPVPWLDIPQMIVTHGVLNCFGFALFGVIGWR